MRIVRPITTVFMTWCIRMGQISFGAKAIVIEKMLTLDDDGDGPQPLNKIELLLIKIQGFKI